MPVSVPPPEVLKEFTGATTRHTRRVEIYESDGTTRWVKDTVGRLKDGSISVDYSRDERRGLDLTLSNDDGVLINAPGEFWYDKIIKVFRGVTVNQAMRLPKIMIAGDSTTTPWGPDLRAALASMGFGDVQINVTASTYAADLANYDIIVMLGAQGKGALMQAAYNAGKSVFVFREGAKEFYDAILGGTWTGSTVRGNTIERRRNFFNNPSAATATDWGNVAGTTGVVAATIPTTGGYVGTTFYRATWTTANTVATGAGIYVSTPDIVDQYGLGGAAATAGKTFTASMWVRSSVAQVVTPNIEWKTAGGASVISTTTGAAFTLPANTWTRVWVTGVAPATTARMTLTVYTGGTGSAVMPINSTLDGDAALIEVSPTLNDYFDGTNAATKTQTFSWVGTANASASIMTSGFTERRRNQIPMGGATVLSGGTGYSWNPWAGTGGVGTTSTVAAAWAASGKATRITWTTATTAVSGDNGVQFTGTLLPNTKYTASITVVSSKAQRLAINVGNFAIPGGASGSGTGTIQSSSAQQVVAAGTPTTFTITFTTGANTVTAKLFVGAATGTGGVNWAINDYLDASNAIMELGATVGAFFDGTTADADPMVYEWLGAANTSQPVQRQIDPGQIGPRSISGGDPRTNGWKNFPVIENYDAFKVPTSATGNGVFGIALHPGLTDGYDISAGTNSVGGKFVAVHFPLTSPQYADGFFRQFLWVAVTWLNPVTPLKTWEVQIGEFMIDRINESHFPFEMKVTGRDYTKKCIMSKFPQATMFEAGQTLEGLISNIAANAGITKMLLPATGITIGQPFTFDRGSSRWDAMKQIATAYNYEIFFDASGYLVIRPFRDPTTTAPVVWINTGANGVVASYTKSTSDASLFNHILVTGENSDQTTLNVYAEAINTNPASPTRVAKIGDRYWEYSSSLITTTQQAQDLATTYLRIHSLEEFELDFETLIMPWLEVGDILGWIDPNPAPGDPRTFLLSSITLPLKLGPMSGVGKRVLIVGV
jgi:hypothetical protein